MNRFMRSIPALFACVSIATAACSAQQKFPLRHGEWEATTASEGQKDSLVLHYCMNDQTWMKALTQNPVCTLQQLNYSSRGASYNVDCPAKSFQMKGRVDLNFVAMEHMTAKGAFDMTVNGKTSQVVSTVDYRWKAAACNPNDINLRANKPN